ncbi:meiotic recombination protein SPO11-1-like isoform X3 [Quercus robur]|uniref:meiotic recombination protein SPO11-1-like isoform X3 n=1 Tax=Quercus robur TaxID=38942 RepID=UPI0021631C86|nr:meiotic recombination protein SPO11-1-like isoform X3 [Quercus robur]
MEGNRGSSQRCALLRKIKEFTRAIVQDLSIGRSPIVLIDRFRVHCTNPQANCCCSSVLPNGKEILTLQRENHVHRLATSARKPAWVQERYILHASICIFRLVMGWIRFLEGGRKFDCINRPNTAHPIPVQVEEVKDIVSVADYILVVEKESVFERLANDRFCNANRCIVITGRGYPDIPTRRFLRLLIEKLCLPTYCLVDCDPYGFDILTTYRFGSMQMAYDAKQLRCPEVCWLGVFPSDSEKYCLPQQCFLPLTAEDKKKAETMLNRCYLQREVPRWRLELELMLQRGVKFEIEALSVHSLSFLSKEYITSKIQGGVHI